MLGHRRRGRMCGVLLLLTWEVGRDGVRFESSVGGWTVVVGRLVRMRLRLWGAVSVRRVAVRECRLLVLLLEEVRRSGVLGERGLDALLLVLTGSSVLLLLEVGRMLLLLLSGRLLSCKLLLLGFLELLLCFLRVLLNWWRRWSLYRSWCSDGSGILSFLLSESAHAIRRSVEGKVRNIKRTENGRRLFLLRLGSTLFRSAKEAQATKLHTKVVETSRIREHDGFLLETSMTRSLRWQAGRSSTELFVLSWSLTLRRRSSRARLGSRSDLRGRLGSDFERTSSIDVVWRQVCFDFGLDVLRWLSRRCSADSIGPSFANAKRSGSLLSRSGIPSVEGSRCGCLAPA